jgi:Ca2+-binding RTX toxin-like protein
LFNFDVYGYSNFKLSGLITISVSDSFSYSNYSTRLISNSSIWTASPEYSWNTTQINDIQAIAGIFSSFANLNFSTVTNYDYTASSSLATPRDVGNQSNINISIVNRPDISSLLGISGGAWDSIFGYTGGNGDIVLNIANPILFGDYSFSSSSKLAQVLMHEMGHSLGLAHPHSGFTSNGSAILTSDFSATQYVGFSQLGFAINSAADMNKEYFTIMSYDDENTSVAYLNAYTPMILDVIALQNVYGAGTGTSGASNDTITAGTVGYRTYFDTGGTDTVDLSAYTTGAYFNMGVSITSASHLVGLLVNADDASKLFSGGDPTSLRWFYGEYENANGGEGNDLIIGNSLNNFINGGAGNDILSGGVGNDTFDWDPAYRAGNDTFYGGTGDDVYVVDSTGDTVFEYAGEGTDTIWANINYNIALVANVENLSLFGTSNINATGNSLNNTLTGNSGNNALNGGAGIDTAVYTGTAATHTITIGNNTSTVVDKTANRDGSDTLTSIERLKFTDTNIALDISKDQTAGSSYMLYKAAFNREPDVGGLGFWISKMDGGMNYNTVAQNFINSAEFKTAYGGSNPSVNTLVTKLYNNVLIRNPDGGGLAFWQEKLSTGGWTAANVLGYFATSPENVTNVTPLIAKGIAYTEWVA